ncbi:hypothetical protein L861_14010 [Litchfieldella anticariensis FP35 = DSM 16096]|uniref:Hydroxyacid dehydrogenase n=1 Tax=Litchfieldella anticariensis (strain DSM 16096 / CECT 5854 / CIP 108499 / LMG 22089 / FP35) TaxID=1121939 RepID=S2KYE2_LITA3|nr:Ldh family oxidoreductase [Halomonas anticariensis]EPC00384.1 hypothetical protein L861_14010 [Halomonas anticariensis FP35 = DSM 16096]
MKKINDTVTVSASEANETAIKALCNLGLSMSDATEVSEILVTADLMGIRTHGIKRVTSYGERVSVGGINTTPNITVEHLTPTISRINGDNAMGPLLGTKALNASIDIAKEYGTGISFVNGSNHFGPIMPYAFSAAEQGFVSFICSNATTTIAPTGGKAARHGNNPLGFGIPSPDGNHVLLDMALSMVARAKIREARDIGQKIPDTWATDANGLPTTDPTAALDGMLQAVGGHKGYGLALIVDLLCGLLSNASYLTHVKAWDKQPDLPQNLGHFFFILDAKVLGSTEWLSRRMTDFAEILHNTPAADPRQPVILPGERELKNYRHQKSNGLIYDEELYSSVFRLAENC